jgi:putative transposase
VITAYIVYYNTVRLHSAIGYLTPADKLAGRSELIWAERKRKLAEAEARRKVRQSATSPATGT